MKPDQLTQAQLDCLLELLRSARKLNEIVEGMNSARYNWQSDQGFRLKDHEAWCQFYVDLKRDEFRSLR